MSQIIKSIPVMSFVEKSDLLSSKVAKLWVEILEIPRYEHLMLFSLRKQQHLELFSHIEIFVISQVLQDFSWFSRTSGSTNDKLETLEFLKLVKNSKYL